ncbi:MAG: APC family permease [Candidatus Micrarchaeia archaeon]
MSGKENISVIAATAVGLGAIIGAGIFVLSGSAIALAGSNALLAFIFVGIVALLVALELGELGSIMPRSKGASYSYAYNAFGSELGFVTGILLYFSYSTSISAISLGFGSYLASLLGIHYNAYIYVFAIALIGILSFVNLLGIKKAANADALLVFIKIFILVMFIAMGIVIAFSHNANPWPNFSMKSSNGSIGALLEASVAVFFAYSGFQAISTFTDRVKGGARNAAKAIIMSVIISIILYALVVFTMLLLVPAGAYKIAADPLAFALGYNHAPQWLSVLVDIGALIATTSATLAMILSSSRMLYQISDDRLLPALFRKYSKKSDVAINGVIFSSLIGIIMLFSGNIFVIAAISNFGLVFSYLMSSFAVIHFRRAGHVPQFKMPLYPYSVVASIVLLMVFILGMPKEALMIGTIMILSLIIVYYFLRELKGKKVVKIKLFK